MYHMKINSTHKHHSEELQSQGHYFRAELTLGFVYLKPQFNEFYQRGDAAPLNSDEAEENEEAEVAEGAEGAYGAEGAEGAYGAERAEPAAEELTIDPAAVSTDAPVDHEVPHDYLLASDTPNVEVNVADNFDPVTESSLPYLP